MYKELDIVRLTHEIKNSHLAKGAVGAIVDVYGEGKEYEVEFVDELSGKTTALLVLKPKDIELPVKADIPFFALGSSFSSLSHMIGSYNSIKYSTESDKTEAKTAIFSYQSGL